MSKIQKPKPKIKQYRTSVRPLSTSLVPFKLSSSLDSTHFQFIFNSFICALLLLWGRQPLNEEHFQSIWDLLKNAIDKIHANEASNLSFEELYR